MLVAMDFDSTLAQSDPYVRLAQEQGQSRAVATLLDRVASDEVSFENGIRSVADHLEGLQEETVEATFADVDADPAAAKLVASLRAADHHVAIVSDAPERAIHASLDAGAVDVDSMLANRLLTADGALTGAVQGPLLGRTKAAAFEMLSTEEAAVGETVAIGGDRRDLPMLHAADTGIGVDPTPVVDRESDHSFPSVERAHEWFEQQNVL